MAKRDGLAIEVGLLERRLRQVWCTRWFGWFGGANWFHFVSLISRLELSIMAHSKFRLFFGKFMARQMDEY